MRFRIYEPQYSHILIKWKKRETHAWIMVSLLLIPRSLLPAMVYSHWRPPCLHGPPYCRLENSCHAAVRKFWEEDSNMIPQKLAPVGTHLWLELVKKTEEIILPPFQVLESDAICRRQRQDGYRELSPSHCYLRQGTQLLWASSGFVYKMAQYLGLRQKANLPRRVLWTWRGLTK